MSAKRTDPAAVLPRIINELARALEKIDAPIALRSALNSHRDGLTDWELVAALKDFNATETPALVWPIRRTA